jgi:hypothetical protein
VYGADIAASLLFDELTQGLNSIGPALAELILTTLA